MSPFFYCQSMASFVINNDGNICSTYIHKTNNTLKDKVSKSGHEEYVAYSDIS